MEIVTDAVGGFTDSSNTLRDQNELNVVLDSCYMFPSDVYKGGKMVRDTKIRNSKETFDINLKVDENMICKILNNKIKCDTTKYHCWFEVDKTLMYTSGMHFGQHTDNSAATNHVGTLLIFPPKSLIPFTGGELSVGYDVYDPNETEWTMIYLDLNTLHGVHTVTSGTRVSFKYFVMCDDPNVDRKQSSSSSDSEQICDTTCHGIYGRDDGW